MQDCANAGLEEAADAQVRPAPVGAGPHPAAIACGCFRERSSAAGPGIHMASMPVPVAAISRRGAHAAQRGGWSSRAAAHVATRAPVRVDHTPTSPLVPQAEMM
jgi:hypothetical protein